MLRQYRTCVAFDDGKEIIGAAATQTTDKRNTISNLKQLLCRHHSDPYVKQVTESSECQFKARSNGGVGIIIHAKKEETLYSPEKLTGILLNSLDVTTSKRNQKNCVVACPVFFTNAERQRVIIKNKDKTYICI